MRRSDRDYNDVSHHGTIRIFSEPHTDIGDNGLADGHKLPLHRRYRYNLGDEGHHITSQVHVHNLWQPVNGSRRSPLILRSRSITRDGIVHFQSDLSHADDQWYYLSDMKQHQPMHVGSRTILVDDALLFSSYDPADKPGKGRTLHCAAFHPLYDASNSIEPPRISSEFRFIWFPAGLPNTHADRIPAHERLPTTHFPPTS